MASRASMTEDGSNTVTVALMEPPPERPTQHSEAGATDGAGATLLAAAVGRYVPIEELGRGGMGVVLRAYDPRLQREVALKSLRPGTDSMHEREDILREAQSMARLSHPNVVAIYDVTMNGDRVVLTMECVRGKTLKDWLCDPAHAPRAWQTILDAFCAAGRGLAAAHDVGLLHGDFKPANVLVGDDGRVRVADFGLARLYGVGDSDATRIPPEDVGLIREWSVAGTPRYMAPEQHEPTATARPLPASDQYAFCVALWEALVGQRPFAGETLDHLLQAKLCESPSWSRNVSAPRWVEVALRRGLAPNPEDRWPTMLALLQVLSSDPQQRRRRVIVGATMTSVVMGAAGVAWGAWQNELAKKCSGAPAQLEAVWSRQRRQAIRQAVLDTGLGFAADVWSRIEPGLDAYAASWKIAHVEACEATTVRGEQSVEMMDLRMACLHRAKGDLLAITDLLASADEQVVMKAHQLVANLPRLARCSDVEALQAEVEPPRPEHREVVEEIQSELSHIKARRRAGRYEDLLARLDQIARRARAVGYRPLDIEVMVELGQTRSMTGDYAGSEAAFEQAFRAAFAGEQWELARLAAAELVSSVGMRQARPSEGLAYAEVARGLAALTTRSGPRDAWAEAQLHNNVGNVLWSRGHFEDAELEFRHTLELLLDEHGPEHQDVATARNNLGAILARQEKHAEAKLQHRQALEVWKRVLGPEHPAVSASLNNLANVFWAEGKYDAAEVEYRSALAVLENAVGREHPEVGLQLNGLGAVLVAQGKNQEAELCFRRALALLEKTQGPEHPMVALTLSNLASALFEQGQYAEAETFARQALTRREKLLEPRHPDMSMSCKNLGDALAALGKYDAAEVQFRRALTLREEFFGPDHVMVAQSRSALANALLGQGRATEALQFAERGWNGLRSKGLAKREEAFAVYVLARALWESAGGGERIRAVELAKQAASLYAQDGKPSARARQWLQRVLGKDPRGVALRED